MEKRKIDPEKKKAAQTLTLRIMLGITALIVIYVIYSLVTKNTEMLLFEILLGVFVIAYTLLTDVAEPYQLGLFQNMTIGQRSAFTKMMAADVVGVAALLYWIAGMGSESDNNFLFPVIIYFLAVQMKRKFRPEFEGIEADDEADTDLK